jgi:DNA-directed RNA polymerase II subunit RPB1
MGLVQDALLGSLLITRRDTFIDFEGLMQILMMLPDDFESRIPTPAIIKPKKLWTGK